MKMSSGVMTVYFIFLYNDNVYRKNKIGLQPEGAFMRITSSMLRKNSSVNALAYTRKNAKVQSISRNKKSTATSALRGRQVVNNSLAVDNYIKLGENAEYLRRSANVLGSTSKNNVFENARNTGSNETIVNQAKQLVSGYNRTMNGIKNDNSSLNRVYRQLLENAATENSESLSNIGITVNRDKTLSIDETKMKNASVDDLEAALGSKSGFTSRAGSMAENVSRNAISTATNLSSAYSSYGASLSSYSPYASLGRGNSDYLSALFAGTSRFNFWG